MEQELAYNALAWVRKQKAKLEKMPANKITPEMLEVIDGVEFFAHKRLRELRNQKV